MKTLLISALLTCSFFSQAVTTTEYTGKAKMKLSYYAFGYNDGEMPLVTMSQDCLHDMGTLAPLCLLFVPMITGITLGFPLWGNLNSTAQKSAGIDVKLKAYLENFDNGRAQLVIDGEKTKGCEAISLRFLAEEDGYGGHTLFANAEASANGLVTGTVVKIGNDLRLEIPESSKIITKGKDGKDCVWHLEDGLHAKFSSAAL